MDRIAGIATNAWPMKKGMEATLRKVRPGQRLRNERVNMPPESTRPSLLRLDRREL